MARVPVPIIDLPDELPDQTVAQLIESLVGSRNSRQFTGAVWSESPTGERGGRVAEREPPRARGFNLLDRHVVSARAG